MSKGFFFGRTCRECESLGVYCTEPGLLTFSPAGIVHIDGQAAIATCEKINQCPVIRGTNTAEKVVAKLRETYDEASKSTPLNQIGNY
jgi:hypothetical protein